MREKNVQNYEHTDTETETETDTDTDTDIDTVKMENLSRVDEEYETRMAGFEIDCNDGKGEAMACHQVGQYFSVVKDDFERSASVYAKNCESNNYPASCFNYGKMLLAGKGVEQSDEIAQQLFSKACKVKKEKEKE